MVVLIVMRSVLENVAADAADAASPNATTAPSIAASSATTFAGVSLGTLAKKPPTTRCALIRDHYPFLSCVRGRGARGYAPQRLLLFSSPFGNQAACPLLRRRP